MHATPISILVTDRYTNAVTGPSLRQSVRRVASQVTTETSQSIANGPNRPDYGDVEMAYLVAPTITFLVAEAGGDRLDQYISEL